MTLIAADVARAAEREEREENSLRARHDPLPAATVGRVARLADSRTPRGGRGAFAASSLLIAQFPDPERLLGRVHA